jgi:choline dehydrogenase-like flavoprotein
MASSASEADLCILGSGIAGMLLAERALAKGRQVLMIERGTAMTFEQRRAQGSHDDPLPFNRSPQRLPHEGPPLGPRIRWDRDYPYWPVYNLGGCTNVFFGNTPRIHPSHFDQPSFAGGVARRWPVAYAELEPYYLEAEHRLAVAGNSSRAPFSGRFDYPLRPHRLSPSDRACQKLFGEASVIEVPTVRPSEAVGARPPCCGSNTCHLCPIDSKGTALNSVYPAIRNRVDLRSGLLATEIECQRGRVRSVTAVDAEGKSHRIRAREFVVACNGVDSCLLLQRSPTVPKHPALGRYFMDHPIIQIALYDTGVDARPGYGDSSQTGMLVPFFERAGDDLPISMLGEIRTASLGEPSGSLMRDILTRELFAQATAADGGGSIRRRFTDAWRSTLDLWFLVETQPLASQTVSIDRIEPTGQAVPKISLSYPSYFAACVERLLDYTRKHLKQGTARHVGSMPTSFHWLGSTRMGMRPEEGCVDASLRYHDLDNLFVLSTSVFPSASSANPTLTLAALALRLGDRLGTGPRPSM